MGVCLRRLGGLLAVVCALTSTAELMPGSVAAASATHLPFLSQFDVRLTVAPDLPKAARAALIKETETIWRKARVRIQWLSGGSAAPSTRSLRVLVTAGLAASQVEGPRWAVGELLRFEDNGAIAMASIPGARRIVDDTRGDYPAEPLTALDRRLGLVLGRAVAHEIGHYLLNTNTHAKRGLMRATFDSREFSDLRGDVFALDADAEARLSAAAAFSLPLSGLLPLSGFSYNSYNGR